MPRLTVDVNTNLRYLIDYVHIDVFLYHNETKQTYAYVKTAEAGSTPATALRTGEFPGLQRGTYTLIVKLLDAYFRPTAARKAVVSMVDDRVTRVPITRR
jgi:hypothetical protein